MLIAAALFALFGAAPPAKELVLEERQPLAMLVISGNVDTKSAFSVSELVRHVSAALAKHTSLYVLPEVKTPADEAIAACDEKRRLSCWVRAVKSGQPEPRYLLAVSFFHDPNAGERVAALLIDVPAAAKLEDAEQQRAPGWEDRVEDGIFQRTASTNDVLTSDLGAYFESVIAGKFRADFEANGHFEPYGSIAVEADRAGLEIFLDGTLLGTTAAGTTMLLQVMPGRRTVTVADPKNRTARAETVLLVSRQGTAPFNARGLAAIDESAVLSANLTFWTGIGLAAAGTILTVWAASADPGPELFDTCFSADCKPDRFFATLCELTERNASCAEQGGVLAAPLGYSLMLTGGAWAVGTQLFTEEGEVPWLPFVVGLAAGALAYGVSAALDESRPAGAE